MKRNPFTFLGIMVVVIFTALTLSIGGGYLVFGKPAPPAKVNPADHWKLAALTSRVQVAQRELALVQERVKAMQIEEKALQSSIERLGAEREAFVADFVKRYEMSPSDTYHEGTYAITRVASSDAKGSPGKAPLASRTVGGTTYVAPKVPEPSAMGAPAAKGATR